MFTRKTKAMPLIEERQYTTFDDGTTLSFAKGKKDLWCVYYYTPTTRPVSPRDQDYFQELLDLANKYGNDYVYEDFVDVYDHTDRNVNPAMAQYIIDLANKRYPDESLAVAKLFTILYMAMVAEYYYVNRYGRPSRLKKRTKRLGVHQILMEGMSVIDAKEYSKGRNFAELDALCRRYGF